MALIADTPPRLSRLVCLTRFEDFQALEAEWTALAEPLVDTVFLTHYWLTCWWRHYGADAELRVLVARDGDELVGAMPLMLRRSAAGIRSLEFVGAGEVTPNHLDLIARPDRRASVLSAIAEHIRRTAIEWDVLELDKLPADSDIADELGRQLRSTGLRVEVAVSARCRYAILPDSFDAYLGRHSHSQRGEFRQKRRRLERDYPTTRFGRAETSEQLDRVMEALVTLHQARWTGMGYPGAFATPRFVAFHRAVAAEALTSDRLRLYFAEVDSRIVAVNLGYRAGDCVQGYLSGHDDEFARYSPGMLVCLHTIEQSIAEGARRFDTLEGDEAYKGRWATETRENLRLRAFGPHWRGAFARVRLTGRCAILSWGVRYVPLPIRRPLWQLLLRARAAWQRNRRLGAP